MVMNKDRTLPEEDFLKRYHDEKDITPEKICNANLF